MSAARAVPRLKERYDRELRPQLQSELGVPNIMQVPRLQKIVINCGVGRATQQASLLDGAVAELARAYTTDGIPGADRLLLDAAVGLFDTEDARGGIQSFLESGPGKATFAGR